MYWTQDRQTAGVDIKKGLFSVTSLLEDPKFIPQKAGQTCKRPFVQSLRWLFLLALELVLETSGQWSDNCMG